MHMHGHQQHDTHEFMIELPQHIKYVHINIGCNLDPPMPPADDDAYAVIAVEPVLKTAARIPSAKNLFVIVCAIADVPRFQTMHLYNAGGLSSSLSRMKNEGVWFKQYNDVDPRKGFSAKKNPDFEEAKKTYQPPFVIVPVMSLRMLLNSIPSRIEITSMHTDMQGYDFLAVRSAGKTIRRIKSLQTEVTTKGTGSYRDVNNSMIDDWVPWMRTMGYNLTKYVACVCVCVCVFLTQINTLAHTHTNTQTHKLTHTHTHNRMVDYNDEADAFWDRVELQ